MPTAIKNVRTDGLLSALGGVDSGRLPNLLDADQVAWAINATLRGGYLQTRPGFVKRTLVFEDTEQSGFYGAHKLQGTGTYTCRNVTYLVSVVEGRVFLIDPGDYTVREITPTKQAKLIQSTTAPALNATVVTKFENYNAICFGTPIWAAGGKFVVASAPAWVLNHDYLQDDLVCYGDNTWRCLFNHNSTYEVNPYNPDYWEQVAVLRNISITPTTGIASGTVVDVCDASSPEPHRAWVCQADKWLIIQNGLDLPILHDGSTSRRSRIDGENQEVPTGRSMVYANGRLWVNVGSRGIAAGDIYGGPTDVIQFTEETYLAEGGTFHVEQDVGGLFVASTLDTSMGQGPIMVFTRNRLYSINVPADRAKWKDQTSPIQTLALVSQGTESAYSIVGVNSDLFYRAPDGIRSFIQARREFSNWGNVPVSTEVDRALIYDDDTLLPYSSAMLFGNRLYTTYAPRHTQRGIYHQGMVVLDFTTVARMSKRTAPAWEGVWSSPLILPVLLQSGSFDHVERGFIFGLTQAGTNELWEICENEHFDNHTQRIVWAVESRSLFATDLRYKKIDQFELWADEIRDKVDIAVQYRPDQIPCWYDWNSGQFCSVIQDCAQTEVIVNGKSLCKVQIPKMGFDPGYRTRVGFGSPPAGYCEHQDFKDARYGYEFQIRLAITGHMRIRKAVVKSLEQEEQPFAPCINNAVMNQK